MPADEKVRDDSPTHYEDVDISSTDSPNEPNMSIGRYFATRLSTLKPPMEKLENPITLLRLLNRKQWLFFWCAFVAWTWDAFDFFTVSLTVSNLAETFDRSKKDITWGITLVLMFRSVGAITFGLASDRYGRKWPFVVNNISECARASGCRCHEEHSSSLVTWALISYVEASKQF